MNPGIQLQEGPISIPIGKYSLNGDLKIPKQVVGLVLFAHGSASSRLSSRNQFVAKELNRASLATFLFDLLTTAEESEDFLHTDYRFNIDFLGNRLTQVTDWVLESLDSSHLPSLPVGLFGASTGAAAALITATERPNEIKAVVSRGGRPDLAVSVLHRVTCPTLLIVGGRDETVLHLNRDAYNQLPMSTEKDLAIVPGATHLFEEPGALEQVAHLASHWFRHHLI